ncbi:hypothetical protein HRG_000410 [Hirsutella rhossiliensis]|uniref:Uncharacterized protein n=1 Tax=Hirsutella rhossiliensis TaxID=111463 RepID=A0A9P8N530_9HYPO|nr:uncharacterized protein HRG_00410 [Hirsutella rhossiliensis]KAH0967768.1 hypothetical protein HRG_00410 [Hirsutella rhossiliensis]
MPFHYHRSASSSFYHCRLPHVNIKDEITIKEVTEAGVMFVVTTFFLAPYIY